MRLLKSAWPIFLILVLPLSGATAEEAFDLVQVADGVYAAIGRPEAPMAIGANAAVIVNADDVLIVDTHYTPSAARALLAQVRTLTDKPVQYVVNTHWHNDHTQGNEAYFNVFPGGVEFISHHATREDIERRAIPWVKEQLATLPEQLARGEELLAKGEDENGQPLSEEARQQRRAQLDRQRRYLEELKQMQITLPTLTFESSLVLHKPDRTILILFFFRGHTRGDVVVFLPRERVLVAGDLITSQLPFPRDSYPAEWVKTLGGVAELKFDQIIPGHGPVQKDRKQLELITEVFASLVEQVRDAVWQGLSLEETRKVVNLEAFRERVTGGEARNDRNFDQRIAMAIERAYLEETGKLEE
jgi:glyoxylase-like metal-dependent hydrolase (beta-lactamase superfamily II)